MNDAAAQVADRLSGAKRVLFVTGAGLSADSGLPTYRGVGGLYEDEDATEEGMAIEEALSGPMLLARPDVAWRHIARIEKACRGARPNRGHAVIAELERRFDVVVLTQNVDGFHAEAGSTKVIDIHGDVHRLKCTACSWKETVRDYSHLEVPPQCPVCGQLVRPDVVLFEEMLPTRKLLLLEAELSAGFDVAFSVGTSALFAYIAAPMAHLRSQGAFTVEVNPGESAVSHVVELVVRERAAAFLDAVAHAL
ncbi:MAG: NAD-dependent protein deacylase [Myxococcota bacterium]